MQSKSLRKVFGAALILYCAFALINILAHRDTYQWDLYRYYSCAKAYESGVNPYDPAAVSAMAKKPVILFLYPPIVLSICRPLVRLGYNHLFYLYFILKCLLLAGLIYLWRNVFLNKQVDIFFYLLCLFGFNSPIYLDLRAGNITIIEQCIIWAAFFFYLRRNYLVFSALIVAVSTFKMQPVLFLFLLLLVRGRNKYRYLIWSFAAFGIILLLQYISGPELFSKFITGLAVSGVERGIINPSNSALARDLAVTFFKAGDPDLRAILALLFYLLIVIPIIFTSALAYLRLGASGIEDKEKWGIFFACSVYALIAVYFKDYSYILLIVPAYFIIKRFIYLKAFGPLIFLASISAVNPTLPGAAVTFYFLWNYYPLFLAYLVWGLYLYELRRLCPKIPPSPQSLEQLS